LIESISVKSYNKTSLTVKKLLNVQKSLHDRNWGGNS